MLLLAEQFLRENLPIAGRVVPGLFERIDEPLYPPVALREALANALCHRDYAIGGGSVGVAIYRDRLEITSSGSLHFGLTAEKLFEPHDSLPWNPLIARVFHRRGIIETWGRGTLRMAELTKQAGLPPLEIQEGAGCVVVTFRPGRFVPTSDLVQGLTARQQLILSVISSAPEPLPLRAIRAAIQPPAEDWEVKGDLSALKAMGLIESTGRGRGASWRLARGNSS